MDSYTLVKRAAMIGIVRANGFIYSGEMATMIGIVGANGLIFSGEILPFLFCLYQDAMQKFDFLHKYIIKQSKLYILRKLIIFFTFHFCSLA